MYYLIIFISTHYSGFLMKVNEFLSKDIIWFDKYA